jgi:hypothetical protein
LHLVIWRSGDLTIWADLNRTSSRDHQLKRSTDLLLPPVTTGVLRAERAAVGGGHDGNAQL